MSQKHRSANFSKSEEERLIALVLEEKQVLENKKTDAVTSKQKEVAWEKLAEKFNATSESNLRTPKVSKEKYNNIKRTLRKSEANARKELFMTGGGPALKSKENLNPLLDQLSDVMGMSVSGLPARHDDDQFIDLSAGPSELVFSEDFDVNDFIVDGRETGSEPVQGKEPVQGNTEPVQSYIASVQDWSKCSPAMLRTKKSKLLMKPKQSKLKHGIAASETIVALKEEILKQQLEHARLEHEQRMNHSEEEHKLKMLILEAELKTQQK